MDPTDAKEYYESLSIYLDEVDSTLREIANKGDDEGDMDPEDTFAAMLMQYSPEERLALFEVAAHAWSRLGDFITAMQQVRHLRGESLPPGVEDA